MNTGMTCRRFAFSNLAARNIFAGLLSLLLAATAFAQAPAGGAGTNSTANPARRGGRGGFGFGRGGFGGFNFPPGGFGFAMAPLPAGVKAERNIPYVTNGSPNQVLDLFLPEKPSDKPLPLMIWIHGGEWLAGDQHSPPVLFLATNGYAVASIQYRFSTQAIWPAQAYDCKAAIRWLRANAAKYNFDPDRFGVGGDSSGGHLAAVVGTSGGVKDLEGDLGNTNVSSRVQCVVDWFGPTDLLKMGDEAGPNSFIQHSSASSPESMLVGGPIQQKKELARTANPITYVNRSNPPFLIEHGDNDQLVPHEQSVILAKALVDAGASVTMVTLHGAGHEDPRFRSAQNLRLVENFLDEYLKPGN